MGARFVRSIPEELKEIAAHASPPNSDLLQRPSRGRRVPAFRQELLYRALLDAFLNSQLIVQKMVEKRSSLGFVTINVNAVDANTIAVTIRADEADLQIRLGSFLHVCFSFQGHRSLFFRGNNHFDERRRC
jgi:hypothetical protein